MLYAKKSKKTNKYYLCYTDIYGSIAFPTNELLNNKALEMYDGIDITLPSGDVKHYVTMYDIKNMLKKLNDNGGYIDE